MKKNYLKTLCFTLVLACIPVPTMAANVTKQTNVIESEKDTVFPLADVCY